MIKIMQGLRIWWHGIPPSIVETEDGGFRVSYQNPNNPPARDRVKAMGRIPQVKWMFGPLWAVIITVVAAAISKWVGLR